MCLAHAPRRSPSVIPAQALDLAVDRLYRREPFASDRDRLEHLFGRYEALVAPLEREGARQNARVARRAARVVSDPV